MNKKNLHKPNEAIMIQNKNISASQRKMYNVLLLKASYDLRKDPSKRIFKIDFTDLKEISGVSTESTSEIENNLKKLVDISIERIYDKNNWEKFSLLSTVIKKENELHFDISFLIVDALLKNNYYTTLNLLTIKSLNSKYSVALYEILTRYKAINTPFLEINDFKELLGAKNYTYRNFRVRILEKAINEINEKTDLTVSYETKKRGRKIIAIKFNILQKIKNLESINPEKIFSEITQTEKNEATLKHELNIKKVDKIIDTIPEMTRSKELKTELLEAIYTYSEQYIQAQVDYVNKRNIDHPKGFLGYLKGAIDDNYAKAKNNKGAK